MHLHERFVLGVISSSYTNTSGLVYSVVCALYTEVISLLTKHKLKPHKHQTSFLALYCVLHKSVYYKGKCNELIGKQ